MTPFKLLPHTADIQVELTGADLQSLYQAGADAVRSLLVGESPVAPVEHREVALAGADPEEQLMTFLRELVYRYDTERFLPAEVRLDAAARVVTVRGEALDPTRHTADRELKGVTYHGFRVEQSDDGWRALVVFDV